MNDLDTELTYKPTLWQRLSRVILGTLLVPLFGDICVFIYSEKGNITEVIKIFVPFYLFILTYIIAIIFTSIPTLIFRIIMEWSTQKLNIRLFSSFVFAIGLGVFLTIIWSDDFVGLGNGKPDEYVMWILSSIVAVVITELLLYQHIKRCIKKQNQESFRQPETQKTTDLGD